MNFDSAPMPDPGSYWIVYNSAGLPLLQIQTRDVRIAPFRTVDEDFAWDEGEDDRSLKSWRASHIACFKRSCDRWELAWSEDMDVLFERFEVIWPRAAAERRVLRRPCTTTEWTAYHTLRRIELFERYLPDLTYDPEFPEN